MKKKVPIIGSVVFAFFTLLATFVNYSLENPSRLEKTKSEGIELHQDSATIAFNKYLEFKKEIVTNNVLFAISHYTSILNSLNFNNTGSIIDKINSLLENAETNYVSSNYPIMLSPKELHIVEIYFKTYIENNKGLEPSDFIFYLIQMSEETISKIQKHDFENS